VSTKKWDREAYEREVLVLVQRAAELSEHPDPTAEMKAEADAHLAVVHRWVEKVGRCWGADARAGLHQQIVALGVSATAVWLAYLSDRVVSHDRLMASIVAGVVFTYEGQKFKALPEDYE
jgi:hypothetical protein